MTMTSHRYALLSTASLLCVLAIDQAPLRLLGTAAAERLDQARRVLNGAELDEAGSADHTAGYYEGLLNESSRISSMGAFTDARFLGGRRRRERHPTIRALRLEDQYLRRDDFLAYSARPNLDVADYDDESLRLITNSRGLSDREYPLAKPAGHHRIAVLGDSVTRGQGAPFGRGFEPLLEEALNENGASRVVEVINFAVSGYRVTQLVESALHEAAAYDPDVYLVAVSELTVFSRWGDHLKHLVDEGIYLKYEFLRDVVRRSGLEPGDPIPAAQAKLAPFRLATLRWAIETIRDHASRSGGRIVVLLVPTVKDSATLDGVFEGVPETLELTGVPAIDLLRTFEKVPDLNTARVSEDNYHPNERGHALLLTALMDVLRAKPELGAVLLGTPPRL